MEKYKRDETYINTVCWSLFIAQFILVLRMDSINDLFHIF